MDHVVFFSGGMSSFFTALRAKEKYGKVRLLFTDTKYEDEDLYRFLEETSEYLDSELVILSDGRDPWQIFKDVKFLGNSRVDPCSKILKRDLAQSWIKTNYPEPDKVVLHLGMNWDEEHRLERSTRYWKPYKVEGLLTEPPYLSREDMTKHLRDIGIKQPRLYDLGFPHNNCGGFCIKAGQAHFKLLLEKMPEKYAEVEAKEQEIREFLQKDVSVLRDRSGGTSKPLTLKDFRHRNIKDIDLFEWGGCGCFGDIPEEEGIE